jgi:hypothetical protein
MLPAHLMWRGTHGREKMGKLVCCRVEGFLGNSYVYGNEVATKYPNILGESRLHIPLSNYFQHYVPLPVYTIAAVSPHYKSRNLRAHTKG